MKPYSVLSGLLWRALAMTEWLPDGAARKRLHALLLEALAVARKAHHRNNFGLE